MIDFLRCVVAALLLAPAMAMAQPSVERGRYVATIGGCNDCHTQGYAASNGEVPQSAWLKGSSVGYQGPWGTSYASNLRLYMQPLSEDQWLNIAQHLETRPPMPWFNVRHMTETDQRSLYRFIRSLGEPGPASPAALPPGQTPETAYVVFAPPVMPH